MLNEIDIGKGKGSNVSYAVFMLIWAAILFFDKEIGAGMLVLAAGIVPALAWMYKIVMQG